MLTLRGCSLKLKGKLYAACVRSVMVYGSETWAMKEEDVRRLERTEMQMVRWMCGARLKDEIRSSELRNRLGIDSIVNHLRTNRLRWFGHVKRADDNNWIKQCQNVLVPGRCGKGRPRKRWNDNIKEDPRKLEINENLASDRDAWKIAIKKHPSNPC